MGAHSLMADHKRTYPGAKGRFHPGSPQGRRRDTVAVGDLIGQVVKQAGLEDGGKLAKLKRAWLEAVGKDFAGQTRLQGLKAGVLTVEVDSAALAQELSVYYKRQLLRRLGEQTGVKLVDLRCRVVGRPRER